MAAILQGQANKRFSLDALEDRLEDFFRLVTIVTELTLLVGVAYAGYKLAHKGTTPGMIDELWIVTQIIALDMSAPGMFARAKIAREQGDKGRAWWTRAVAILLIVMSILTMVQGAIEYYLSAKINPDIITYSSVGMIIARCCAAVGYSVFCRLSKQTAAAPAAQPATPVAPAPAPIDIDELARAVAKLIPAAAPAQPAIDQQELARLVAQLVASMPAAPATAGQPAQQQEDPVKRMKRRIREGLDAAPAQPGENEATREQVRRILADTPDMKAAEIALKVGCTRQTVYNHLKALKVS